MGKKKEQTEKKQEVEREAAVRQALDVLDHRIRLLRDTADEMEWRRNHVERRAAGDRQGAMGTCKADDYFNFAINCLGNLLMNVGLAELARVQASLSAAMEDNHEVL